jgi:hypothetical protein
MDIPAKAKHIFSMYIYQCQWGNSFKKKNPKEKFNGVTVSLLLYELFPKYINFMVVV